jgi:hypothetical protein
MFGLYSPPPFIVFVIHTDPRVAGEEEGVVQSKKAAHDTQKFINACLQRGGKNQSAKTDCNGGAALLPAHTKRHRLQVTGFVAKVNPAIRYNRSPYIVDICCFKWPHVGPQNEFYNRHSVYNFVDSSVR